jgi:glutaredoxin 3
MSARRKVEVFSAGSPACNETIELVNRVACSSCEVTVFDMQDMRIANRAKELGISTVPAEVIDGKLAECCTKRGVDETTLRVAGVGVAPEDRPTRARFPSILGISSRYRPAQAAGSSCRCRAFEFRKLRKP